MDVSGGGKLQIEIEQKLSENQAIIPVTFNGKDFQVTGNASREGDKTTIMISEFPKLPEAEHQTDNHPG
ncbi:MAG: hypothetical protein R3B93_22010 [Bacteroidia bacterium]